MGLALAATSIAIVLSPWGKQSGAHFNPALTFAFYRWRKVALWDAVFYCAAQLLGAILFASNHEVLAPYTHYFAAVLVAIYIAFESRRATPGHAGGGRGFSCGP